jgi:hypothetical protein
MPPAFKGGGRFENMADSRHSPLDANSRLPG